MSPREYLKSAVWDLLLCVLMCGALVTAVSDGFNVDDALRLNHVLVYGLSAVLSAILIAASYSKRTLVPGIVVFAVVCAGVLAYAAATSTNQTVFADEYGNNLLFAALLVVVCLLVFLLSRRPAGAVVLAVAGVFAIVTTQFLYQHEPYVEFALFGVAATINCLFRGYVRNLRASETVKTAFASTIAVSLIMCLIAGGVGVGVWYAVVEPLNPPARELILITEYRAQPEVTVTATTTLRQLLSDLTSNQQPDSQADVDNPDLDNNGPDAGSNNSDDQQQGSLADALAAAVSVTYEVIVTWWLVIVIVLAALIAGSVALKVALRKRRFKLLCALPARKQAKAFYLFFIRRFAKLGFAKIPEDTPREYLHHADNQLRMFDAAGEGPAFAQVADVFERAAFGGAEPSGDDLELCHTYYDAFYGRSRSYVRFPRYAIKFWQL